MSSPDGAPRGRGTPRGRGIPPGRGAAPGGPGRGGTPTASPPGRLGSLKPPAGAVPAVKTEPGEPAAAPRLGVRPKFTPKIPPRPAQPAEPAPAPSPAPAHDAERGRGRGRGRGAPGGRGGRGGRPAEQTTASGPFALGPAPRGMASGAGRGRGAASSASPPSAPLSGTSTPAASSVKPEKTPAGTPGPSRPRADKLPSAAEMFSDEEADDGSLRSPGTGTLSSPDMLGPTSKSKRRTRIKKEPGTEADGGEPMDLDGDSAAGSPLSKLMAGTPRSKSGKQAAKPGPSFKDDEDDEAAAKDALADLDGEWEQALPADAVADLLLANRDASKPSLLFFQLPSVLPKVRNTAPPEDDDVEMDGPNGAASDGEDAPRESKRRERPEFVPLSRFHGHVGKLLVHRSGRATLRLASGLEYRISEGSATDFLQQVVAIDAGPDRSPVKAENGEEAAEAPRHGEAMVLGTVQRRFVAAAEVASLLRDLNV
ncbi:RNA polymerase III RPC4-domain-containing protein [Hyaloraphidium curvatum]|nr:RNA polymerase III RPC4-domain-containing protein [Hyaloraphidium curvatum]